jgi:hypothetical protein
MINHVSVGVRSIAASKSFYDAVFKPLGYSCLSAGDSSLGYGNDAVEFWLSASTNPVPAHQDAGLRDAYGPNYYAAFVIDPDGYRIEAYCSAAE